MKKILTYISVLSIFAAFSCTKSAEFNEGDYALSFEALTSEMETRSGEGDNAYHENDIKTMDWFFFSDEEGTNLLKAYHTTSNTLKVSHDDVEAYGLKGKSYLYAVANAPEAVQSKETLADIKTVPVTTNFTNSEGKLNVESLSFVMDTYDKTTGKYVMALSPKQTADGVAGSKQPKITVPLCRLAVKFTTTVKVKAEVKVTDSFGLEETWTPILNEDDFDVYMMNALKAGYLNGEPIRRVDAASDDNIKNAYFDYSRDLAEVADISEYDEDTGALKGDYFVWQTVDPFYTYPQKWNDTDNSEPYIKIIFPWVSDIKGNSEFHYKVVLPKPANNVFTLDRNCWYNLTATIAVLGGTENDYVLIDGVEVSVANWAEPSWLMGSGLNSAKYFYVPTKEFHVYSDESFDIPINTNSSAVAYITKIEFKDYSTTPTTDLSYSWAKTAKKSSVSNSELETDDDNDSYSHYTDEHPYSVSANTSDRYNKYIRLTHSLEDIYVVRDITIYIQHSERTDWNETVIIHQHPAIELKKQGAGDVFVNGYFGRVENALFGSTSLTAPYYIWRNNDFQERTYTANNSTFYHSWSQFSSQISSSSNYYRPDNTVSVQGRNYDTYQYYGYSNRWRDYPDQGFVFQISTDYGTIMVTTNNLVSSISTDFYTTDIAVTAFSESNNYYSTNESSKVYYKIGDPRAAASTMSGWSLNNYLSNESGNSATNPGATTTEWTNADDILICSQAENDRSIIAPHFLVSSALNANTGLTWNQAVRRAATYQEAGYPAGRWRLPTEAEIAFIIARQNDGTLPTLYATNSDYWAGSGRLVETGDEGESTLTFKTPADGVTQSCRFVYDLWYWGDEPMSANVYHANGHIE